MARSQATAAQSAGTDSLYDYQVSGGADQDLTASTTPERSPWPMVLFAGVALVIGALLMRWILVPRAELTQRSLRRKCRPQIGRTYSLGSVHHGISVQVGESAARRRRARQSLDRSIGSCAPGTGSSHGTPKYRAPEGP